MVAAQLAVVAGPSAAWRPGAWRGRRKLLLPRSGARRLTAVSVGLSMTPLRRPRGSCLLGLYCSNRGVQRADLRDSMRETVSNRAIYWRWRF